MAARRRDIQQQQQRKRVERESSVQRLPLHRSRAEDAPRGSLHVHVPSVRLERLLDEYADSGRRSVTI